MSLAAVTDRIAVIRNRIESVARTRPSFDAALDDAVAAQEPAEPRTQSEAPERAERYAVRGILGNAVVLPSGIDPASLFTPSGPTIGWEEHLPDAGRPFIAMIHDAANKAGIDPAFLAAVTWGESRFRPDAVSWAGAMGLTQLMPGTAGDLGVTDPFDPVQNLGGGARYLAAQLERFGSMELALAAYNAGPGAVSRHGGIPPGRDVQGYVPRILGLYEQLGGRVS